MPLNRYLTFCLVLLGHYVCSQSVTLTDEGELDVAGRMSYLRDPSGSLPFDSVSRLNFMPLEDQSKAPSFGFDQATYWFRLVLDNQSRETNWLLEIPFAPLDVVEMYVEKYGSHWLHKVDGDIYPITHRDMPHRHPVFKFSIPRGQHKEVYIKVKTISSVQLPVTLWIPQQFQSASNQTQLLNGIFYGAMLLMVLYQMVLGISIRDKTIFYYVLTLISMANVIGFFQGYTFLYLHPLHPDFNDVVASLCGPLFVLCSTFLTRSFLNLRQHNRWLDKLMLINTVLNVVAGMAMIFFTRQISYKFLHYFVLIHCVLVLVSAGYCLYKKNKPALYYLIAWATLLLAAVAFSLGNLGILPGYLAVNYQALMIGCVLQVLLITFALAERWNELVKENQRAKELELKREQEENERLEREVKIRTEEIRQQNNRLENLIHVKNKLFSVVSHDIKGPLASLQLSLMLAKTGVLNGDDLVKVVGELDKQLTKTNSFIQNLLQWAKLQLKGETFEPAAVELSTIIEETIALEETELKHKKIVVENLVTGSFTAYVDVNMIKSVFRNLLVNAIKFTPAGGSISIKGQSSDKQIIISITDTGVGIPVANRGQLFTLKSMSTSGTEQETGTGLGLMLSKEFIEKNGGSIWYESEQDKGTTFYFSLPEFHDVQIKMDFVSKNSKA